MNSTNILLPVAVLINVALSFYLAAIARRGRRLNGMLFGLCMNAFSMQHLAAIWRAHPRFREARVRVELLRDAED